MSFKTSLVETRRVDLYGGPDHLWQGTIWIAWPPVGSRGYSDDQRYIANEVLGRNSSGRPLDADLAVVSAYPFSKHGPDVPVVVSINQYRDSANPSQPVWALPAPKSGDCPVQQVA